MSIWWRILIGKEGGREREKALSDISIYILITHSSLPIFAFFSHGPGGQGPEPDPCFAKVVRGREVLEGWHGKLGDEFLEPQEYVLVKRVYIK